jgi:hypothetical protein
MTTSIICTRLLHVILSSAVLFCRRERPSQAIDGISVIAYPKKWKETDGWEDGLRGGKDLWVRGGGEYLQQS